VKTTHSFLTVKAFEILTIEKNRLKAEFLHLTTKRPRCCSIMKRQYITTQKIHDVMKVQEKEFVDDIGQDDDDDNNNNEQDCYDVDIDTNSGHLRISMPPLAREKPNQLTRTKNKRTKSTNMVEDGMSEKSTNDSDLKGENGKQSGQIPESVLQYERQMRKIRAADRAKTNLNESHLNVLHVDDHTIVVNKPSGILCVPGINRNPSILSLVHGAYPPQFHLDEDQSTTKNEVRNKNITMDKMIIHRLDMDTSGIVIFGRTASSVKALHASFRDRKVTKTYQALLCGHMDPSITSGEINLPLQRDHRYPPFMRIATPKSQKEARSVVQDLQHNGWKKLVMKNAKPSTTLFRIMNREMWKGIHPVTRVELTPVTGRTHQLRVHCAAIGHPIVADPAYGVMGEASPNGGFDESIIQQIMPYRASLSLQREIDSTVRGLTDGSKTKNVERTLEEKNVPDDHIIPIQHNHDIYNMCLHAQRLKVLHPFTNEELDIRCVPPF